MGFALARQRRLRLHRADERFFSKVSLRLLAGHVGVVSTLGNLEIARMNDDGPSQVVANRHMRTILRAKDYPIHYVEYSGGHDFSSLGNPLVEALALLLGTEQ